MDDQSLTAILLDFLACFLGSLAIFIIRYGNSCAFRSENKCSCLAIPTELPVTSTVKSLKL